MKPEPTAKRTSMKDKSRFPANSVLFEKIVPLLLAIMGIVTLVLILFAAGVLLGVVRF